MVIYLIIAALIIAADQLSKYVIASNFSIGESKSVIKNIFSLTYVQNKGAAFGILQGARVFFIALTVIVLIAAIFYVVKMRPQSRVEKTALAFVAGGAIGNFIDRAYLGYVRDFIAADFIDFPVFNIADCFVCIGALLYIIYILCEGKQNEKDKSDSAQ